MFVYTTTFLCVLLAAPWMAYAGGEHSGAESSADLLEPHVAESQSFFNGAARHSYPITVPEGTAGLAPSIALSYVSQAKWSQTGYGWSLSAADSIGRSTKCGVPTLDDADTFVWRGEDLIQDTDGTYHTAKESFARIEQRGEGSSSHWLVTTPDGTTYRYGATDNSRILVFEDPGIVHQWALDRVQDTNGNYYTIEYLRDATSAAYYPKAITYTMNDAAPLAAYRTVEFAWEPRPDVRTVYSESTRQTTSLRLATIETKVDGALVARHQLGYALGSGGKSLLTSIQVFGADGVTTTPPTTFRYAQGKRGFGEPIDYGDGEGMHVSASYNGDTKMHVDINGDGFSDEVSRAGGHRRGGVYPFKIRFGTGTGFQEPVEWDDSIQSTGITTRPSHKQMLYASKELRDMDGDGRPDIIERTQGRNRVPVRTTWCILNTGTGFAPAARLGPRRSAPTSWTPKRRDNTIKMLMDVNGDGLPDELYRPYQPRVYGEALAVAQRPRRTHQQLASPAQYRLGLRRGPGLGHNARPISQSNTYRRTHTTVHELVDINGDSLPDDLYRPYTGRRGPEQISNLLVRLNTGKGFGPVEDWGTMQGIAIRETDGRSSIHDLIDINGDGLLDDVYRKQENIHVGDGRSRRVAHYKVRLNTGSGFGPVQNWGDGSGATLSAHYRGRNSKQLLDINGDGLPDDVWRAPGHRLISSAQRNVPYPKPYEARLNLSGPPALLTMVQLPTGGRIHYKYGPSTRYDNTDYTGTPRLANKMWVVTSVTRDDALGGQSTSSIAYRGGLYEGFPKCEFRGFREVVVTNAIGAKTTATYLQDDACWGHQTNQSLHSADGTLLFTSESVWTYRNMSDDGTIVFPHVERTRTQIYDGADTPRILEQHFTYDDYGNVVQSLNAGDIDVVGDEVRTTREYAINDDLWIVNRPARLVVEDMHAGQWRVARDSVTYYDRGAFATVRHGNPTSVQSWISSEAGYATVTTGFDVYGNPIWTRDANANARDGWPVNSNGHTVDTIYDPRFHTLPVEKRNALDHVELIEYDDALRPIAVTDANGNRTVTDYDALGRTIAVTKPGDTQPTVTTTFKHDGVAPEYAVTRSHTADGQWLTSYNLVDGFGRPIQTKVPVADGFIATDQYYDDVGRKAIMSQSYHESELINTSPDSAIIEEWPLVLLGNEFADVSTDDAGNTHIPGWTQIGDGHPDLVDSVASTSPMSPDGAAIELSATSDRSNRAVVATSGRITTGLETQVDLSRWNRGPLPLTVECGAQYTIHHRPASCTRVSGNRRCYRFSKWKTVDEPVMLTISDSDSGVVLHEANVTKTGANAVAGGLARHEVDLQPYVADAQNITVRLSIEIEPGDREISNYVFRARNVRLSGTQNIVRGYLVRDPTQPATRTEHDAAGRVVVVTTTDGTSTTTRYDRGTKTITNGNGAIATHHVDAYGRVAAIDEHIDDAVQTTHYDHRPATGELVQVTDAKGSIYGFGYDGLGRKVSEHDADRGEWLSAYDANGNVVRQQDANQNMTRHHYDALNRSTRRITHDSSTTVYTYDKGEHAIGRLSVVETPDIRREFSYDARGRTTTQALAVGEHVWRTGLAYDDVDRVVSTTYPDGEVVQTSYDAQGFVTRVVGDADYVVGTDYTDYGKLTQLRYGNHTHIDYAYYDGVAVDPLSGSAHSYRLRSLAVTGGNVGLSLEYQYDKVGNVLALIDRSNGEHSQYFSYDAADRLVSASGVYGDRSYAYDAVGNVTRFDGRRFEYVGGNRIGSDGRWSYEHDNNGNVISRTRGESNQRFTFDALNRMTAFHADTSERYVYDEGETRIAKISDGTTTYYVSNDYEEVWRDGERLEVIKHYRSGEQKVATRDEDGLKYAYADHLGSSSRMATVGGKQIKAIWYKPFGGDAKELGDAKARYRYTGKEKDDSGLYYYGARYYDDALGRFLAADSLLPNVYDPQQLNRFAYVRNNPVRLVDPDGHQPVPPTLQRIPEQATSGKIFHHSASSGFGGRLQAIATDPLAYLFDYGQVIETLATVYTDEATSRVVGVHQVAPPPLHVEAARVLEDVWRDLNGIPTREQLIADLRQTNDEAHLQATLGASLSGNVTAAGLADLSDTLGVWRTNEAFVYSPSYPDVISTPDDTFTLGGVIIYEYRYAAAQHLESLNWLASHPIQLVDDRNVFSQDEDGDVEELDLKE